MFPGIEVATQSVKALLCDAQVFPWDKSADFEQGALDLMALRKLAEQGGEPKHRRSKQDWFENVINRYL